MKAPDHIQAAEDDVRRQAIEAGLELVTAGGVAELFGKDAATIRAAALKGRVAASFRLNAGKRPVRLFALRDCVAYWGQPDAAVLERMRRDGFPLAVGNADGGGALPYIVLNPVPLVTLGGAGDTQD